MSNQYYCYDPKIKDYIVVNRPEDCLMAIPKRRILEFIHRDEDRDDITKHPMWRPVPIVNGVPTLPPFPSQVSTS